MVSNDQDPERPLWPASDGVDLERAAQAIREFLRAIEAPIDTDPELEETGRRVAEAFHADLLAGYRMDPSAILSDTTAEQGSGIVILSLVPTTIMCPHHLLPAVGHTHVAYQPGGRVVGLGALARLVECYSRRLILQEKVASSITEALIEHLGARGAGCIVQVRPACVGSRGSRCHGALATTMDFRGENEHELRAALLTACNRPAAE